MPSAASTSGRTSAPVRMRTPLFVVCGLLGLLAFQWIRGEGIELLNINYISYSDNSLRSKYQPVPIVRLLYIFSLSKNGV